MTRVGARPRHGRSAIARAADGAPGAVPGVPLDVQGTAFQWTVWKALQAIPAGETRTYAEVAAPSARPSAFGPWPAPAPATRWRWWSRATGCCQGRRRRRLSLGRRPQAGAARPRERASPRAGDPLVSREAGRRGRSDYNPRLDEPHSLTGVSPVGDSPPRRKARTFPTARHCCDEADVVVIGGGLTGLLTAWGLKAAGRGVSCSTPARSVPA